MAHVLIVYASNEGQTRKIAQRVAERIEANGHTAHTADVAGSPPPYPSSGVDAYIIGASVHEGKHQRAITHFVRENVDELRSVRSAFFSVSLSAALDDEEHRAEVKKNIDRFLEDTDWQPDLVASFAGALLYTQYDFLKRLLMKMIAKHTSGDTDTSRDYEYTDWEAVDRFADTFLPASSTHTLAKKRAAKAKG